MNWLDKLWAGWVKSCDTKHWHEDLMDMDGWYEYVLGSGHPVLVLAIGVVLLSVLLCFCGSLFLFLFIGGGMR